jgi:hypothetical protein
MVKSRQSEKYPIDDEKILAVLFHAGQAIEYIIRIAGGPDGTANLRVRRDWG